MKRLWCLCFLFGLITILNADTLLIDDFPLEESWAQDFNALGQESSFNTHGNSSLMADVVDTIRYGSSGGSLKLTYNQPTTLENDAWYWWSFIKGIDITVYESISFYVRGGTGGERFRIGFDDAWGYGTYIYINDLLPQGITTTWQKVIIYFEDLGIAENNRVDASIDKYSIQSLNIKNDDRASHEGTLYIDSIQLNSSKNLVIENFDVKDFKANYTGGRMFEETDHSVSGEVGCSIEWSPDSTNAYGNKGDSLKIFYSNPGGAANWTNYWLLYSFFRAEGGFDASSYNTLSAKIKGAQGGEMFRVALKDNSSYQGAKVNLDVTNYLTGGVTTNWQDLTVPLSDFIGLDLENLKLYEFNMDYIGTGAQSGTVFIDDFKLKNTSTGDEILLDDFDQSYKAINSLGKLNESSSSGDATMNWKIVKNSTQEGDYSDDLSRVGGAMELKYTATASADQWYWRTHVEGAQINDYEFLVFWVRGDQGGEKFKIRIEDTANQKSDLEITRYLAYGCPDSWNRVTIPFHDIDFTKVDRNQLKYMGFYNSDENIGSGTVYIDQLMFAQDASLITLDDSNGLIQRFFIYGRSFSVADFSKTKVLFYFTLARQAKIKLRIYDVSGKTLRTILLGDSYYSQGSHRISWDGKMDNGETVQRGLYLFQLYAEDISNNSDKKMSLLEGY